MQWSGGLLKSRQAANPKKVLMRSRGERNMKQGHKNQSSPMEGGSQLLSNSAFFFF